MNVRFISVTQPDPAVAPDAEALIVYCARVSSPANQDNHDTGERLLRYCMKHGHWSIFEQASMTLEITTSRAISAQILRHKSFSFQEFSQRYAEVQGFETYEARRQDTKNRQASHNDLPEHTKEWFKKAQATIHHVAENIYREALEAGIAKESARFLLPMSSTTRLYMTGSVRSWIHYFAARCGPETQLEHRQIAWGCRMIFEDNFPTIADALKEETE